MGVFSHSRFRIFNQLQHPLKHRLNDFGYSNPAFGGQVRNLQQAMDWICAVLYPNQKPAVADVASLPASGNSIGDMRVVNDDGDGKSASYRWEQREGDASPQWYKIYDVDFSTDSILAAWNDITQDQYVSKQGRDDTDSTGTVITGILAGQSVYGGKSANTNLSLFANSGDGAGPVTGFVQFGNNLRPIADNTFSLGNASKRFSDVWSGEAHLADFIITDGSITSASADIDFGSNNLTTSGIVTAEHLVSLAEATLGDGSTVADFTFHDGSLVSASGEIDFGSNDLVTLGMGQIGQLNFAGNVITSDVGIVDFGADDVIGITTLDAQDAYFDTLSVGTTTPLLVGTNGNISKATALSITSAAALSLQGLTLSLVGPITASSTIVASGKISGPQLEAVSGGKSLLFNASSTDLVVTGGVFNVDAADGVTLTAPDLSPTGATTDLGSATNLFQNLFLSGSIGLASGNAIGQSALDCLRNAYTRKAAVAPSDGDSLFWDAATGTWYADHPDSEIDHGELAGLTDDDHAQYLLLAGRAGGQTAVGGTASGNNLVLASTSHASKGLVLYRDVFAPETDGTNLGTGTKQIGDLYIKGQGIGFRAENTTTVTRPSASAAKAGRIIFDSTPNALFVDIGGSWVRVGIDNHGSLQNLNLDDHTQYLLLAGRTGGQVAIGGSASNENLILQSTSHASRGFVLYRDVVAPETDGTDIGTASKRVGDLYIKGQGIGFRAENKATVSLPANNAANVGRLIYDTTANTLLADDGTQWRTIGAQKFIGVDASNWNGSATSVTYTVSSLVSDATKCIWELNKTSNGQKLHGEITKTTTQVTVTFKAPPPAASYTLIGVG